MTMTADVGCMHVYYMIISSFQPQRAIQFDARNTKLRIQ